MRHAALAAALLLARPAAAADADAAALQAKAAEWEGKGFALKDRVSVPADGMRLAAAVYAGPAGAGDRLEAYVALKGKAFLGYSHPGQGERLELDSTPAGRGFGDLLEDGSRALLYRSTLQVLNASTLHVLRYQRFKFTLAASFPEGRVLDGKGGPFIVSRDLPLGRFLSVGCEDFGTISQTAFRTRVYAASKGRFVDVSARRPELFASEIARKEAALERLRGDLEANAGEYLGLALSIYYDYAARGERRRGWERQGEFFRVPSLAPPRVRSCFQSMRQDLRSRLAIPADWP